MTITQPKYSFVLPSMLGFMILTSAQSAFTILATSNHPPMGAIQWVGGLAIMITLMTADQIFKPTRTPKQAFLQHLLMFIFIGNVIFAFGLNTVIYSPATPPEMFGICLAGSLLCEWICLFLLMAIESEN